MAMKQLAGKWPGARFPMMMGALGLVLWVGSLPAGAQEGVLLTEDEAPRAVFPTADRFERAEIPLTEALRARVEETLQKTKPSVWEPTYVTFTAWQGDTLLGRAFLVEEIGKHRPITFIV